jgi:hypothetical protein
MIKWLLISREHIYSTEASGVSKTPGPPANECGRCPAGYPAIKRLERPARVSGR